MEPLEIFIVVIVAVAALLFNLVFLSTFYNTKMGKYEQLPVGTNGNQMISTDYGKFLINHIKKEIRIYSEANKKRHIPFSKIEGLWHGYDTKFAFLPEFLFGGWPLFKKYEDTYEWFHIYIMLKDSDKIPIYSIGNLERRGFAVGWMIFLEKTLFRKWNIYENIEKKSRRVFSQLQDTFRNAKIL